MRYILAICFCYLSLQGYSQYFNFSQRYFSEERNNPAFLTTRDNAFINVIYRSQNNSTEYNLRSNLISIGYPVLYSERYGSIFALGGYIFDDKTIPLSLLHTSEIGGYAAVKVPFSNRDFLSFGLRGTYNHKRFSFDGLYTENQFIENVGFDRGLYNGETLLDINERFLTLSAGFNYQYLIKNTEIFRLGVSWLDFNHPKTGVNESFTNPAAFVLDGSFLVGTYPKGKLLVNGIFSSLRRNVSFIGGTNYHYFTQGSVDEIIFLINVSSDGYIVSGVQLDHKRYRAGASYDFNWNRKEVVYNNTIELSFQLKGVFKKNNFSSSRKKRRKRSKVSAEKIASERKIPQQISEDTLQMVAGEDTSFEKTESFSDSVFTKKTISGTAKVDSIRQSSELPEESKYLFYFNHNSYKLSKASEMQLKKLAEFMKSHPYLKVRLIGHTDDSGTAFYNQRLSVSRAEEVRKLLIKEGVDPVRIFVSGKGESNPLVPNKSEENRSKNRRVSLELLF